MAKPQKPLNKPPGSSLFAVLTPYRGLLMLLIALALLANAISLVVPKMLAVGIDSYVAGNPLPVALLMWFLLASFGVFLFTYFQNVMQTVVSERVARDLRTKLAAKISRQSNAAIQTVGAGKLLTNLTADIDSIKLFIAQAVASLVSSLFIIVAVSIVLLVMNARLALCVLAVLPLMGGTFFFILGKVRKLFMQSREVIDWLNKVINESILGAALIRVLNSQKPEAEKFLGANTNAQELGMKILGMFAAMIPVVTFLANFSGVVLLAAGGHDVITGAMTLGEYTAFANYLVILIFPIFMIGFMSGLIAQAQASYVRIHEVLSAPEPTPTGTMTHALRGDVALVDVGKTYGEKQVLQHVSLTLPAGTKTAVIGPTAAGKTQLLELLTGLGLPDTGTIQYDGHAIGEYDQDALHRQIGFVFQDSILFRLSVRDNIAFGKDVTEEAMKKAMETAELTGFIESLPEGINTVISERGTSLSGGQKQRLMLARALALNPKVLLLDDFTARVDTKTEQNILANVHKNYPGITLVSVTQKISSIEAYDQIVLLMEGEVIATGTHAHLLATCPEYVQIYESQRSTSHYELHAE